MRTRELEVEYVVAPSGRATWERYDLVVADRPDAPRVAVERLLHEHPEQPAGPLGEMFRELLLFEQIQAAAAVAVEPGIAFRDNCLWFTVVDGRVFLVPLERIGRITLGPVRELQDVNDERLRRLREGRA